MTSGWRSAGSCGTWRFDLLEGQNSRPGRSLRPPPRPESAGGVRPGLRRAARNIGEAAARTRTSSSSKPSPGWPRKARSSRVRLALFAEMVKGKPWTPATLKEVGGTEGVGVTFLEETFSAATAPPEAPPAPEGGPGGPESPAARDRHRHQGPDAVAARVAGGVGLRQPSQGLRRPDPHPRRRTPPHHADRPGRQRGSDASLAGPSRARNTTNSPTTTSCRRCGTG